MALAKDIMTKNPEMLGSGEDILNAVEFFNEKNITSTPVITPLGEIIGQMTESDLVRALVLRKAVGSKTIKLIHVQDMMDPVFYVQTQDPMSLVLREMIKSPSHRVLVRDEKAKVVGIISPKDLLRSLNGDKKLSKSLMDELRSLNDEVVDLREKVKDIKSYLDTYESLFQSGLYMIHSADSKGNIIISNEKMHQVLGYKAGELIGKSVFEVYPDSLHSEVKAGLKKLMKDGKQQFLYSSMRKKNGDVVRVDLASTALRDDKGVFLGTFTITRPIESENLLRSLFGVLEDPKDKPKDPTKKDE